MKFNTLKEIYTVLEVEMLREKLKEVRAHLFLKKDIDLKLISQIMSEQETQLLLLDLKQSSINIKDQQKSLDFIDNLIDKLDQMEKVSFIFSFLPKQEIIKKVFKQLDLQGKFIMDYSVDPSIYGGVIILKQGKVLDYSIKKQVERILK